MTCLAASVDDNLSGLHRRGSDSVRLRSLTSFEMTWRVFCGHFEHSEKSTPQDSNPRVPRPSL